jgi:hypothetical protein
MPDPELALAALGFVILFGSRGSRHLQLVHRPRAFKSMPKVRTTQNVQAKLDPTGPTSSIASVAAGKIVVSCAE